MGGSARPPRTDPQSGDGERDQGLRVEARPPFAMRLGQVSTNGQERALHLRQLGAAIPGQARVDEALLDLDEVRPEQGKPVTVTSPGRRNTNEADTLFIPALCLLS